MTNYAKNYATTLSKPRRVLKFWYTGGGPEQGSISALLQFRLWCKLALNMTTIEVDVDVLINYQHAMDFHKCISFYVSMVDHTTSRNSLDRILLVLPHNPRYYRNCPVGYFPSFCIHAPNPTEFRPSTSSHLLWQSQKVQSSNHRLFRSPKHSFL